MKWESLLALVGDEPVFTSGLLLAGGEPAPEVRLQLSRWMKAGRLVQLRRGLYALGPTWRKVEPHPFLVANRLRRGSYVSLQAALAWYGAIPEHAPVVTSVGPGRPQTVHTSLGVFVFHHLAAGLSFGYASVEVAPRQAAFVALPEKALLDMVHLTPGADSAAYLGGLRLQYPAAIRQPVLEELAHRSRKAKLMRAARLVGPLLAAPEGDLL